MLILYILYIQTYVVWDVFEQAENLNSQPKWLGGWEALLQCYSHLSAKIYSTTQNLPTWMSHCWHYEKIPWSISCRYLVQDKVGKHCDDEHLCQGPSRSTGSKKWFLISIDDKELSQHTYSERTNVRVERAQSKRSRRRRSREKEDVPFLQSWLCWLVTQ